MVRLGAIRTAVPQLHCHDVCVTCKFLYSAVSSPGLLKALLHFTSLADLFNQTPSQPLGTIQTCYTINVQRLLVHISTSVYSQVLIYTAE